MAPWIEELHVPHLDIPVTIDHILPILPGSSIPAAHGDTLYLSNLDDMIGTRVFTPTVYFYRSNSLHSDVAKILKESLASVLVPYYPFSGRLRETKNGKLEVFFRDGQGVLFVEAHSDMATENLGDLTVPNPAWISLIYRFPNEEPYKVIDMPLLIAQLTQFSCGGFSLGLRICHCLCDGLGAMQFLNSWAATARTGSLIVNPTPCWEREIIFHPRDPPRIEYPHMEFRRIDDRSSLTRSLWQVKPNLPPQWLLLIGGYPHPEPMIHFSSCLWSGVCWRGQIFIGTSNFIFARCVYVEPLIYTFCMEEMRGRQLPQLIIIYVSC